MNIYSIGSKPNPKDSNVYRKLNRTETSNPVGGASFLPHILFYKHGIPLGLKHKQHEQNE